ncbi:MerR family transcriptional regulator [Prauserella cavernicola]|uniref:MerR family transcriptional regulator n=1 Tax=Prauserella cavernicola TaxID=2800127 RepID=A0A934V7Z0_9PSEU|nr:MerR family transcriptional regulator [Prauserella cavernicola]MBK1787750.1 MerR family transcriptional regulator [Prauserella cavernicola]
MNSGAGGTETRQPALWTPGRVARLLGVSPITLRSWDARYGIGPSVRVQGRQRRYSDSDVARLRRMRQLIDEGVRTREAALAVRGSAGGALAPGSGLELEEATEELRLATMATALDESLAAEGAASTWQNVAAPVLRSLGTRWERGEECFAIEWGLAAEISAALNRHTYARGPARTVGSVLLAPCPGEHHVLPLEVLRAALAERGVAAVFTGAPAGRVMTLDLADRLDPAAVLLWAMTTATADTGLAGTLAARGRTVYLAGPGWNPATTELTVVNDLDSALDVLPLNDRSAGDL